MRQFTYATIFTLFGTTLCYADLVNLPTEQEPLNNKSLSGRQETTIKPNTVLGKVSKLHVRFSRRAGRFSNGYYLDNTTHIVRRNDKPFTTAHGHCSIVGISGAMGGLAERAIIVIGKSGEHRLEMNSGGSPIEVTVACYRF